jgi:hypothetical protein
MSVTSLWMALSAHSSSTTTLSLEARRVPHLLLDTGVWVVLVVRGAPKGRPSTPWATPRVRRGRVGSGALKGRNRVLRQADPSQKRTSVSVITPFQARTPQGGSLRHLGRWPRRARLSSRRRPTPRWRAPSCGPRRWLLSRGRTRGLALRVEPRGGDIRRHDSREPDSPLTGPPGDLALPSHGSKGRRRGPEDIAPTCRG